MPDGGPLTTPGAQPWTAEGVMANACDAAAVDCERRANELRAVASKIRNPPNGVRVEIDLHRSIVRFVGPALEEHRV